MATPVVDPTRVAAAEPLLEVTNLRTYFYTDGGVARAVDGVSFHVSRGEVLGIVGESGSGKSVTSLSIMRLIPEPPGRIEQGSSIRLHGSELLTLSEKQMRQVRGNDIAMIFQEPMTSLNPVHPVGRQIVEALRIHRGMNKRAASERAVDLLDLVGIPDARRRADEYPHQLSGGMRQRVMIAMALACEPDLLIADEPTTALDVTIQAQILELLAELRERLGMAIVLITHDLGVVAEVCDRVVVMYAGEVVEEGPVLELFEDPRHPYTQGLLQSIPRLGHQVERLAMIPGLVPAPTRWPTGCRFHPRCPYGWELTLEEHPELFDAGPGRWSRCWLEKYPERRAEVDRTTGGFAGLAAGVAGAPAETLHAMRAPESSSEEADVTPRSGDPDVDREVNR